MLLGTVRVSSCTSSSLVDYLVAQSMFTSIPKCFQSLFSPCCLVQSLFLQYLCVSIVVAKEVGFLGVFSPILLG
jgi:hypothetical protein